MGFRWDDPSRPDSDVSGVGQLLIALICLAIIALASLFLVVQEPTVDGVNPITSSTTWHQP